MDDLSPFSPEGSDRSYNGEKRTTTFAIDARTGDVRRVFTSAGVANPVNNDKCKPNKGLEEDLDDECESVQKTILIGRTGRFLGLSFLGKVLTPPQNIRSPSTACLQDSASGRLSILNGARIIAIETWRSNTRALWTTGIYTVDMMARFMGLKVM